MAFDLGSLLQQYAGGSAPPANVDEHFDQVAQNASPADLSQGLAAAFRSDQTPPFGQMWASCSAARTRTSAPAC